MHITDLVTLIDHTTATMLLEFVDNFKRTGRGIATIVGLDKLRARSHAEACMRSRAPILAQERAEALTGLARISLTHTSPERSDPVAYLELISLYPPPTNRWAGGTPGQPGHGSRREVPGP